MATKKIHLRDSQEALMLFGQHDQNLRALERSYTVQIFGRGHVLSVRGSPSKVEKAILAIEEMRENLGKERSAPLMEIPVESAGDVSMASAFGKSVRPRTPNQRAYVN